MVPRPSLLATIWHSEPLQVRQTRWRVALWFGLGCSGLGGSGFGRPRRRHELRHPKTAPHTQRQQAQSNDSNLAGNENHEPLEGGIHESIGMQTYVEHVNAEPREAGDDIAKNRQVHDSPIPNEPAPARVQNQRVPQNDEQGAVLFGIPAPKSSPRLVGPNSAEDSPHKTEQCGEADDAVHHFGKRFAKLDRWSLRRAILWMAFGGGRLRTRGQLLRQVWREQAENDIKDGEQPGKES